MHEFEYNSDSKHISVHVRFPLISTHGFNSPGGRTAGKKEKYRQLAEEKVTADVMGETRLLKLGTE